MAICAAGCISQAKLPSLHTYSPLGSPSVTILLARSVRTLAFIEMKSSRPPDLSVILKCQPPICLDYKARNRPQLVQNCICLMIHFTFFLGKWIQIHSTEKSYLYLHPRVGLSVQQRKKQSAIITLLKLAIKNCSIVARLQNWWTYFGCWLIWKLNLS